MKLQYASDLHLEFEQNGSYLKHHPLPVTGDILVLAGDIGYLGDDNYSVHPFWTWASDNYERVIVIPGNHEFYKYYDIDTLYDGWSVKIRDNVTCYYNSIIGLGYGIDLIVSTLWSKIKLQDAFQTESGVTDFHRIMSGCELLNFERFNKEHEHCFNYIKKSVNESNATHLIVATHHVPSFELMSPQFKGSALNGAFTVELGEYIATSPIEYWIYGHSHRNIDKTIGRTKCISNQLGYVFNNEHLTFDGSKYLEI